MKKKIFSLILGFTINLYSIPIFNSITTNRDTLVKYNKFEITINLTANFNNPFNQNEIYLRSIFTSPSGKVYTIDGFYFQDFIRSGPPETLYVKGSPHWKIRFTPNETGEWNYTILCTDNSGTTTSPSFTLFCTESDNKGFIRVANQKFLKYENGEQFFGIGLNMAWYDYPEKTYSYEKWLDSLSKNNGNLIRIWMSENAFAIEWKNTGLGNYMNRLDRAYQLDWLFEFSRSKNIYIMLCLVPHGQFSTKINPKWNDNPYNSINGGPCSSPDDFFVNPFAKELFKQRLSYIIARWGYAVNLVAWELFNEVDLTDNFSSNRSNVTQWLLEMAQYIKSKDYTKRIITTSYANEFLDSNVWSSSLIEVVQIHHYNTTTDMQTAQNDLIRLYLSDYNKPTSIGEYDFLELGYWAAQNDPNGINFHNTIWATSFSGAYSTAMTWSWENYIAPKGLFYHFKGIGEFFKNINLLEKNFSPVTVTTVTTQKSDFPIAPAYPSWGKGPVNIFYIQNNGTINPTALNLSKFLYGTVFNAEHRNPPNFYITYSEPAEFKVIIGNQISTSPRLQIWLNDIKRLDQIVNPNATYSITMPAGEHHLFIDNQGIDWMRIAEYVFTNFVVALRCYALASENEIIGWVHNRNYNWRYLLDLGTPPPAVEDGKLIFKNLPSNSIFTIEWKSTFSGELIRKDTIMSSFDSLVVEVPPLQWDYAFHLIKIGQTGIEQESASSINFDVNLFPNPFNDIINLQISLKESNDISVEVYNLLGEKLFYRTEYLSSGINKFSLNLSNYSSGVYLLKISTPTKSILKKALLLK